MATILILKSDWDSGSDPVPYYATVPAACLNFNSSLMKSRQVLTNPRQGDDPVPDCEHGVEYDVVYCDVADQ